MNIRRARVYPVGEDTDVESDVEVDSTDEPSAEEPLCDDGDDGDDDDGESKMALSKSWSILKTSRMVELTNLVGRKFRFPACIKQSRLNKAKIKLCRTLLSLNLAGAFGCVCKPNCPVDKIPLEVLEDKRYAISKCLSENDAREVICNMLLRHPKVKDGFTVDVGPHCEPLRLCPKSFAGILGVS